MDFGVTDAGYVPKTTADCKADLEADLRAQLGATIDLSPEGPIGQVVGVLSERLADLWAAGQSAYAAFTPDGASKAALRDICAITGTVQEAATKSKVTLTATGTPGTPLPAGRIASVGLPAPRFDTLADATITAVTAWAATHTYAVLGERATLGSRVYQVITPGVSAGSGGPTGTGLDITDGSVHWRYVGEGTGAIDVAAEAEKTGPLGALAGTVTIIETPVSGWSTVVNLLDVTLGTDLESDPALRFRREDELREQGNAVVEAIREKLLDPNICPGVVSATVFQNVDDVTDADGVPAHAVEALVFGGDDDDIRAALYAATAGGIKTHGTTSGTITDSEGRTQTIKFTRPTLVNVWVIFNLIVDEEFWPVDGQVQVQANAVIFGNAQKSGKDVVASSLGPQAFKVLGVLDCPPPLIGLANPPTVSTTLVMTSRQLAVFDTSRITVNFVAGTP